MQKYQTWPCHGVGLIQNFGWSMSTQLVLIIYYQLINWVFGWIQSPGYRTIHCQFLSFATDIILRCRQEKELFNDYKVVTLNIFGSQAIGGHLHAILLCLLAAEFSSVLKDWFRYMPDGTQNILHTNRYLGNRGMSALFRSMHRICVGDTHMFLRRFLLLKIFPLG